MAARPRPWVLFDWGNTLMSEDGPLDIPMALWPEVKAVEGAHETLATLSRRYRVGVATNASISTREMIQVALGRAGLRDYVDEIFCYTEIGARKESDEFWRVALDVAGVEPDDIAMVGDTLECDVLAPRRFGIHAIWFRPGEEDAGMHQGVPRIARLTDAIALLDAHFKARR
ncbi:MAG TPA: HAD family hydrolase [Usitatibacter sp.]|nr:HAD family hydrolase [Usitatibacter sp.]